MSVRGRLIDPGDTSGVDEFLIRRCWRRHPDFIGLWSRDGGEFVSSDAAVRLEQEEQKAREFVKAARFNGSDDDLIRREIAARREYETNRQGSGRTKQIRYAADGDWGFAKDPAAAAERSRTKL